MQTIGIAGLSKNAGKTTLVNNYLQRIMPASAAVSTLGIYRKTPCVQSVLKKPALSLPTGCYFTSIPDYINPWRGLVTIIDNPKIQTAMGALYIYQANAPLSVYLAGPATSHELNQLSRIFELIGVDYFILDSSLDRKSVLNIEHIDEMILVVGATYSPHLDEILLHTEYWVQLSRLPIFPPPINMDFSKPTIFYSTDNPEHYFTQPFLGNELEIFHRLIRNHADCLFLPSSLIESSLHLILPLWKKWNGTIILKSAFNIQISPAQFLILQESGLRLYLVNPILLREIVINSYSSRHSIDCQIMRQKFRHRFPDMIITDITELPTGEIPCYPIHSL